VVLEEWLVLAGPEREGERELLVVRTGRVPARVLARLVLEAASVASRGGRRLGFGRGSLDSGRSLSGGGSCGRCDRVDPAALQPVGQAPAGFRIDAGGLTQHAAEG